MSSTASDLASETRNELKQYLKGPLEDIENGVAWWRVGDVHIYDNIFLIHFTSTTLSCSQLS